MVRATPFNLLIGLLAAAGAAKAATSLPLPHRDTPPARLILANTTPNKAAQAVAVAGGSPPVPPQKAEPPQAPVASAEAPKDPAACATPEVLMQSIRQERDLLAKQKAALADREARLALARQGVDAETKRLKDLKTEVQGLLKKSTDAHDADLGRLVKLYGAMKPQDAAGILDSADLEVTVMVLATMNERTAAAIMSKMTTTRVQAVSKIILERSKLPGDQNVVRVKVN